MDYRVNPPLSTSFWEPLEGPNQKQTFFFNGEEGRKSVWFEKHLAVVSGVVTAKVSCRGSSCLVLRRWDAWDATELGSAHLTKDQKNLVENFYIAGVREGSETDCGAFWDFSNVVLTIPFANVWTNLQICYILRMANNYAVNLHRPRWIQLLKGKKKSYRAKHLSKYSMF